MSYYLIDAGDEMAELAIGTYEALKKLEHHVHIRLISLSAHI
jgi:hypothetical protein